MESSLRRPCDRQRSGIGEPTIELIQSDYDQGRTDAERDGSRGTRRIYVQTRGAWGQFLFGLMRDRYDIFVAHVSDITTAAKLSYERGYNSIVFECIDELDGTGATERIWAEVDAFRADQYRKYLEDNAPPVNM